MSVKLFSEKRMPTADSHSAEGGNVKTKEGAAYDCNGGDEVYVAYLIHGESSLLLIRGSQVYEVLFEEWE